MESKFNDKVTQINNAIGEQKLKTETKIQKIQISLQSILKITSLKQCLRLKKANGLV